MIYHLLRGLLRHSLPECVHQFAALPSFQGSRVEGHLAFLSLDVWTPYSATLPQLTERSYIRSPIQPPAHIYCLPTMAPRPSNHPRDKFSQCQLSQYIGPVNPTVSLLRTDPPASLCPSPSRSSLLPSASGPCGGLDCTWISNIHLALKAWSKSLEGLSGSSAVFPISYSFGCLPQLLFHLKPSFFIFRCTCRWVTILEQHHQNTAFRTEKQIPGSSSLIHNEEMYSRSASASCLSFCWE